MRIDPFGFPLAVITLIISSLALVQTTIVYRKFGTETFKYMLAATICSIFMSIGFCFPVMFFEPESYEIVWTGQILFAGIGVIALGYLTSALEMIKDTPNQAIMNVIFILSGASYSVRYLPDNYVITWIGTGWKLEYGPALAVFQIILFIFTIGVGGQIFIKLVKRIHEYQKYSSLIRIFMGLFLIWIMLMGIVMVTEHSLSETMAIYPLNHQLFFLVFYNLAIILAIVLLRKHPTIFFATSTNFVEMYLMQKVNHEILYNFRFISSDVQSPILLISGLQDSLNEMLGNTNHSIGTTNIIRVRNSTVHISEGEQIFGILIAKRESELGKKLLGIAVKEFEKMYKIGEPLEEGNYKDFETLIKFLFQFAINSNSEQENPRRNYQP
jgi:hypothetical protein